MPGVEDATRMLSSARALMGHDPSAAVEIFERVSIVAARVGVRNVQADAELGLGEALILSDAPVDRCLVHLNRAAVLGEDTTIEALAWLAMANLWQFHNEAERTLDAYARSATLFMDLDDATGELLARKGLAETLRELGRVEDALPQLQRALELSIADDDAEEGASLLLALGELLMQLNDKAEADRLLTVAADLFQQLGDKRLEARTRGHLLALHWPQTDYQQLIRMTELQAEHAAEEGDAQAEALMRQGLARLLDEQADLEGGAYG